MHVILILFFGSIFSDMFELITDPSILLFGGFIIATFLGGLVGFILFTRLYKRKANVYLKLTDKELIAEIINLRTRIQTIYIFGPLLAFLLAFIGFSSYKDLRKSNEESIGNQVDQWIVDNDFYAKLELLKKHSPTLENFERYEDNFIDEQEQIRYIDQRLATFLAEEIVPTYISTKERTYSYYFKTYLQNNRAALVSLLSPELNEKLDLKEFETQLLATDQRYTKLQDDKLNKSTYTTLFTDYQTLKQIVVTNGNVNQKIQDYILKDPNLITLANLNKALEGTASIEELNQRVSTENLKLINRDILNSLDIENDVRENQMAIERVENQLNSTSSSEGN
jgi:hypothetical protein